MTRAVLNKDADKAERITIVRCIIYLNSYAHLAAVDADKSNVARLLRNKLDCSTAYVQYSSL